MGPGGAAESYQGCFKNLMDALRAFQGNFRGYFRESDEPF